VTPPRWLAAFAALLLLSVAAAGCAGHARRTAPSAPRRALPPPVTPLAEWEREPVRTIVLDPGHGGRDPGAIGLDGVVEKDVTLDLAKRMRERLERWGFRVVMTRNADETVSLPERIALADAHGGDLFLSLHVNAAPRVSASGIETYYLDAADERHSDQVAARENGIAPEESDTLQRTLAQLRITEVSQRSALLARHVHGAVLRRMNARYGETEDLGIRKGPFYVLFLSSMPAALVEVGFATNPVDAARLRDDGYRELLADGLASGLTAYSIDTAPTVASDAR
jgi:N-acetylmuramoyl-L-alanine amidase